MVKQIQKNIESLFLIITQKFRTKYDKLTLSVQNEHVSKLHGSKNAIFISWSHGTLEQNVLVFEYPYWFIVKVSDLSSVLECEWKYKQVILDFYLRNKRRQGETECSRSDQVRRWKIQLSGVYAGRVWVWKDALNSAPIKFTIICKMQPGRLYLFRNFSETLK